MNLLLTIQLKCPRYAAPRQNLLSSAAQIFGNNWYLLSNLEKVDNFLHGSTNLDMFDNLNLFYVCSTIYKGNQTFPSIVEYVLI